MAWVHKRVEVHKTEVTTICRYFLKYDEKFRKIRRDKRGCEFCKKPFEDGEKFNLAFTSKGNKLICQDCTEIAENHGTKIVESKPLEEAEV